jgi:hypothetical protein
MNLNQKEVEKQFRSLKAICREIRKFIADERYGGYRFMLTTLLDYNKGQRDAIKRNVKDNDEYLRKAIEFDSKIEVLNEILNKPEKIEQRLSEFKEELNPKKEKQENE